MDIKEQLIKEIEKIDDQIILEQLTSLILDSDHRYTVEFSDEQLIQIELSQEQIKEGNFHKHEDVMKMLQND